MKEFIYIANLRIPTTRAHGIQISKTCEAIASQKVSLKLVVPTRQNTIQQDLFSYYDIKNNFEVIKILVPELIRFGKWGGRIQGLIFSFGLSLKFLFKKSYFYSRNELPLLLLSLLGKETYYEAHEGRFNIIIRLLAKKCSGIVCVSKGLRDYYLEKGVLEHKISVASDAVDFEKFNISYSKENCRNKIGLPLNKKIVMYVGSIGLYEWKGFDLFLEASKIMRDTLFVAVGGDEKSISIAKNNYSNDNIIFVGNKLNSEIPQYLKSANVLVLPNRGNNDVSSKFTSPMKLFEYMASGTPIVASRLPSICEILNDDNSILFKSDDLGDFVRAISDGLNNKIALKKAKNAEVEAKEKYSWENRAKNILDFINNIIK